MLFHLAQVGVDADEVLAFVPAEVENFKSAVILAFSFELPLDTDESLAGGVDGKFTQVGNDLLTGKLFRHSRGGPTSAEEVGDQVAFVG